MKITNQSNMDNNMEWNICRVCLQESELQSLFDEIHETLSGCPTLQEKIMQCSSIKIDKTNNLPNQICLNCIENLEIAYKFRSMCESSEAILHSIIRSTQEDSLKEDDQDNQVEVNLSPVMESMKTEIIPFEREYSTKKINSNSTNDQLFKIVEVINELPKLVPYSKIESKIESKPINTIDTDAQFIVPEDEPINLDNIRIKVENDNFEVIFLEPEERLDDIEKIPSDTLNDLEAECEISVTQIKPIRANKRRIQPGEQQLTTYGNNQKPLKTCVICGNQYKYQHSLESHMRRHRNEKPFKCDLCDKAFVIRFDLNRHMRSHTGQKPYACKYCGRKFADFSSRFKHERIHTGEKPYECDKCGKRFSLSHVLTTHYTIHTGEKKYQCEICMKRFTRSHHLKMHKNIHLPDGAGRRNRKKKDLEEKIVTFTSPVDDGTSQTNIEEYSFQIAEDDIDFC